MLLGFSWILFGINSDRPGTGPASPGPARLVGRYPDRAGTCELWGLQIGGVEHQVDHCVDGGLGLVVDAERQRGRRRLSVKLKPQVSKLVQLGAARQGGFFLWRGCRRRAWPGC